MWFIQSHGGVWNQYALFILYFPNYTTLFFSLSHTETHSHLILHVWDIYKHTNAHMLACPQFLYTHKLIQTHHCVEFIYTYTHALHYSDTHLLVYTNIYICASITLLLSLFLQLTHICIILLCAINPHTPLILLLLCMWFIVTHFILAYIHTNKI